MGLSNGSGWRVPAFVINVEGCDEVMVIKSGGNPKMYDLVLMDRYFQP